MELNMDYTDLMDIAKINLSNIINNKMKEYRLHQTVELKNELINLLNERKELFMFNKKIIDKYI